MGSWGFDDFKKYLKFKLGQRDDLEAAGDDAENLYGIWTNLAYRHLTTNRKFFGRQYNISFPERGTSTTDTTVDGQAYIDVPAGTLYVEDLYDETNNRWLEPIHHRKYVKYTDRDTASAEGEPTEWVRRGSYLYLHSTPDDTYTIRIYTQQIFDDLTGSGTTEIGKEWDEIILQLALVKALKWTKDYQEYEVEKKELFDLLDGMLGVYGKEELGKNEYMHLPWSYLNRSGYRR